jgi:hypothetical protein
MRREIAFAESRGYIGAILLDTCQEVIKRGRGYVFRKNSPSGDSGSVGAEPSSKGDRPNKTPYSPHANAAHRQSTPLHGDSCGSESGARSVWIHRLGFVFTKMTISSAWISTMQDKETAH